MKQSIELIKQKISYPDVLQLFGVDYSRNPMACPVCGKGYNTPCFSVYDSETKAKCFSCNFSGDVIDFYKAKKKVNIECAINDLTAAFNVELPKKQPANDNGHFPFEKYDPPITYDFKDVDGTPVLFEQRQYTKSEFKFDKYKDNYLPKKLVKLGHYAPDGSKIYNLNECSKRILYNRRRVLEASTVYLNEGPKCAELINSLGLCGTAIIGGSKSEWLSEYTADLNGKEVIILQDNDTPGEEFALRAADALYGFAKSIKIVLVSSELKSDIEQFLQNGGTKEKLLQMVKDTKCFKVKIDPVKGNKESSNQVYPNENDSRELLVKTGVLKSSLAKTIFARIKKENLFFRYGDSVAKLTRASKFDFKTKEHIDTAVLSFVTPASFITNAEEFFVLVNLTEKQEIKKSSFNEADARIFLNSKEIHSLPEIVGFSSVVLPFVKDKELLFTKPGFDTYNHILTESSAPEVMLMEPVKALEKIREIFSEFCFLESELDLSRAVAYLITPAMALLSGYTRSMFFLSDGNREGVGKDYLLGIPYIIYENSQPIFSSPCNTDDEYRKFLFTTAMENHKIVIFSNVKGFVRSQALEQYCTSPIVRERVLGENKLKAYPNQALYSMSGNGVSFSPDMERRIVHIRLEYYEEDIKNRIFKQNLYNYLFDNRQVILGTIYTLIKTWFDSGAKLGKKIPSFEEWSSITSGILVANGFQNPFDDRKIISASMAICGNQEDVEVKQLVIAWWEKHQQHEVKAEELREIITECSLFRNLDFNEKSDQIKFSILIKKKANRVYDNKRILVIDRNKRPCFTLEPIDTILNEPREKAHVQHVQHVYHPDKFLGQKTINEKNSLFFSRKENMLNMPDMPTSENIALDFETFYDGEYSVNTMTYRQYCQDKKFDAYLVSLHNGNTSIVNEPENVDWSIVNGKTILAHNAAFDRAVFNRLKELKVIPANVIPAGWIDTAGMCALLQYPRALNKVAQAVLGIEVDKTVRISMNGKSGRGLLGYNEVFEYARKDAETCYKLYMTFKDKVSPEELKLMEITEEMGETGVQIDTTYLSECQNKLKAILTSFESQIPWKPILSLKEFKKACTGLGIEAPESIGVKADNNEWLNNLPDGVRRKLKNWITILQEYRSVNRTLEVLNSIESRTENGRLTYSLKYCGATTGRWSGTGKLNLQNLNRNELHGVNIRRCIIAKLNHILVTIDYSQIESRVLLYLAGDMKALEVIRSGVDIYEAHARATMGYKDNKPLKEVNPTMRQLAKARVLGLGYGCGAKRFIVVAKVMANLTISEAESITTVNQYRQSNSKIIALWKKLENDFISCNNNTYELRLPSGRLLYYRNVNRQDMSCIIAGDKCKVYGGLLTENYVQAVARDVLADAWVRCYNAGYKPILCIHDELVFELPINDAGKQLSTICELMKQSPSWAKGLPLDVEGKLMQCYSK